MNVLSIVARAVAAWVVVGATGLAFWARGLDGRKQAGRLDDARLHRERRWMRRLRFSVRTGQLVLAASPLLVEPSFPGWVLVGVLWAISIATDVQLSAINDLLEIARG